jgi:hypothetical protein
MILFFVIVAFMLSLILAEGWTGQGFPMLMLWALVAYCGRGLWI